MDYMTYLYSHPDLLMYLRYHPRWYKILYYEPSYFQYFLNPNTDLKFDIEDLFYYSTRTITKRGNHLFVSDYGMQVSILSRYGIKNYAISGQDYQFINGDTTDFRSANLKVLVHYHGVSLVSTDIKPKFKTKIHINGDWIIGTYDTESTAAIAYNKAVDLAKKAGINKNFPVNFIEEYSSKQYAEEYTKVELSPKYIKYLNVLGTI